MDMFGKKIQSIALGHAFYLVQNFNQIRQEEKETFFERNETNENAIYINLIEHLMFSSNSFVIMGLFFLSFTANSKEKKSSV